MEALNRCALFSVATRVFSPEREAGARSKDGAIIKSEKVEIIDPKALNPLYRLKHDLFLACRAFGTKLDIMNAWAVPLDNERADKLERKIKDILGWWDEHKAKVVSEFRDLVEAQAAKNPTQADAIRKMAPSAAEVEHAIRAAYVRYTLTPAEVTAMGLESELEGLPEQAAWEIAQDLKDSLGKGSRYSRKTLEVLHRVAVKAGSFGFLSPALEAVPSAVDRLVKSLPPGQDSFKGEEALTIGAMIAFLSDPRRLIEEGRKIESIVFVPQDKIEVPQLQPPVSSAPAPAQIVAPVPVTDVPPPPPVAPVALDALW